MCMIFGNKIRSVVGVSDAIVSSRIKLVELESELGLSISKFSS
jgi:hypothetical protein